MPAKIAKILKKKVLTTKEASVLIGVSLPSIINWADADKFASFKTPGGHRRIPVDEFLKFARDKGYSIHDEPTQNIFLDGKAVVIIDSDKDYLETLKDYLLLLCEENVRVLACSDSFWAGVLVAREQASVLVVDQEKNVLGTDFHLCWKEELPDLKIVMLTNALNYDSFQQFPSDYILINKSNSIQDVSKAISSLL